MTSLAVSRSLVHSTGASVPSIPAKRPATRTTGGIGNMAPSRPAKDAPATPTEEKSIVRSTLDIFLSRNKSRVKDARPPPIPEPPALNWKETLMGIEEDLQNVKDTVASVAMEQTQPINMEPDHIPCPPTDIPSPIPSSTQPDPAMPASSSLVKLGGATNSGSVVPSSGCPVKSSIAYSSTQDSIELTFSVPISWIPTPNQMILRAFLSRMLAEKTEISVASELGSYLSRGIKSFLLLLTGLSPASSSDAETGLFGLSPDMQKSAQPKDTQPPPA